MKDADRVMYSVVLKNENLMKIKKAEEEKKAFQEDEERAFKMIPARPIPYEIKTEYVNYDMRDTFNSMQTNSANNKTDMQAAVSAQATSVDILSTENIYDDINYVDGGENIELNMNAKNTFPMPSFKRIAAPKINEREEDTGIYISFISNQGSTGNQPRLPETSNLEVIRSKLKRRFKLIGVGMAVMMVMAG